MAPRACKVQLARLAQQAHLARLAAPEALDPPAQQELTQLLLDPPVRQDQPEIPDLLGQLAPRAIPAPLGRKACKASKVSKVWLARQVPLAAPARQELLVRLVPLEQLAIPAPRAAPETPGPLAPLERRAILDLRALKAFKAFRASRALPAQLARLGPLDRLAQLALPVRRALPATLALQVRLALLDRLGPLALKAIMDPLVPRVFRAFKARLALPDLLARRAPMVRQAQPAPQAQPAQLVTPVPQVQLDPPDPRGPREFLAPLAQPGLMARPDLLDPLDLRVRRATLARLDLKACRVSKASRAILAPPGLQDLPAQLVRPDLRVPHLRLRVRQAPRERLAQPAQLAPQELLEMLVLLAPPERQEALVPRGPQAARAMKAQLGRKVCRVFKALSAMRAQPARRDLLDLLVPLARLEIPGPPDLPELRLP